MTSSPDPEIPDFIPDDAFTCSSGPREPSAAERAEKAARIAKENDRLRKAGLISDGTGKPVYQRSKTLAPWVGIGAAVAVVIVIVALLAG